MKIIFVHFNTPLPKHLVLNLKYISDKFPANELVLIRNIEVSSPRIKGIQEYVYSGDSIWNELEGALAHPKNFRSNFWFTSLARLLAIASYMKEYPGEALHIESDVIVSQDFPFADFSKIPEKVAYPVVSKLRGVATTLYFRDHIVAEELGRFALTEARRNPQTTDMLVLREFFERYPEKVRPLLFGPPDSSCYKQESDTELFPRVISDHEGMPGAYDGTDIGTYFFGTNPWNKRGKSLLRTEIDSSYADFPKWKILYDKDRKFPSFALSNGKMYPIFTIHMLNKNPKYFDSRLREKNLHQTLSESEFGPKTKLHIQVFFIMVAKSILRRISR
jgi:hypothetical protein